MVFVECPGALLMETGGKLAKEQVDEWESLVPFIMNGNNHDGNWNSAAVEIANKKVKEDGTQYDEGERHVFAWDSNQLEFRANLDNGVELCKSDYPKHGDVPRLFDRSPAFATFHTKGRQHICINVISVHLKSGGGDDTKREVKNLGALARERFDNSNSNSNSIYMIIGDFNLDPFDDAFEDLKEQGFVYNGDHKYTNMHEFLLPRTQHVYDSCWVKGMEKFGKQKAFVVVPDQISKAADDLGAIREQMKDFELHEAKSDQARKEGFTGNAVREKFKKWANVDWSDHKPIKVELRLEEEGGGGEGGGGGGGRGGGGGGGGGGGEEGRRRWRRGGIGSGG